MGVVCCNKVTNESKLSELALKPDSNGNFQIIILKDQKSEAPKLGRSKTLAKKEPKKFVMPKTATDAILITPTIFVKENQGILSDTYQFIKQLGQGIKRFTPTKNRKLWYCI